MDETERLWARLVTTDLVKLNRSLRKAFEVNTLHMLSKSMIDNIVSDIVVRVQSASATAGGAQVRPARD